MRRYKLKIKLKCSKGTAHTTYNINGDVTIDETKPFEEVESGIIADLLQNVDERDGVAVDYEISYKPVNFRHGGSK